jgi:CMP-N-acetylneuraminic acid synthetase
MSNIALIPARSGSKRLKNKNLMELAGKPLIAWTIEAALNSNTIDRVVVTTDCEAIADTARRYGAETPFIRSQNLANDVAKTSDVIIDAIEKLQLKFDDKITLLQPTSPLRTGEIIDEAHKAFDLNNGHGLVSVCKCEHSPLWANSLPKDGNMGSFIRDEVKNVRSQDLPVYYRLNGALYIFTVKSLIENCGIVYDNGVHAFEMQANSSVDIDTMDDFLYAEFLIENNNK